MVTFGTLKANVLNNLEGHPRFTDALLGVSINRALAEVAKFIRYKDEIWISRTQIGDDGRYLYEYDLAGVNGAVPGNWGGILEVKDVIVQNVPLSPMTMSEYFQTQPKDFTSSTQPRHFCVRSNRYLIISPRPGADYEIQALVCRMPDILTLDTDIADMPDALQESVELWATYHMLKNVPGEENRAAGYLKLYLDQIKRDKTTMYLNRVIKTKRTRN